MKQRILQAAVLSMVAMVAGCAPSPKSVLTGTWELTGESVALPTWLVFDSKGNLVQMILQPGDGTTVRQQVIGAETTVTDRNVTYRYGIPFVGDTSFSGTLNDDNTVIAGNLTTETNLILTTIIDTKPATLTKTATPPS